MDLYISPFSCSFAVHVACLEAGIDVALHRVDRASKRLDDGSDYRAIAPQAIVPAIRLPDGSILTEMAAVMQYIADRVPEKHLAPAWGTPDRYRLAEWLHFVGTEIHKKHLWSVFSSKTPPEVKDFARKSASPPLAHAAAHLEGREYLVGDYFTVADIYLFWALTVAPHGGIALDEWPALAAYADRIKSRPSVVAAFAVESPLYAREAAAGTAPTGAVRKSA
jgi:glutathione S-transferase